MNRIWWTTCNTALSNLFFSPRAAELLLITRPRHFQARNHGHQISFVNTHCRAAWQFPKQAEMKPIHPWTLNPAQTGCTQTISSVGFKSVCNTVMVLARENGRWGVLEENHMSPPNTPSMNLVRDAFGKSDFPCDNPAVPQQKSSLPDTSSLYAVNEPHIPGYFSQEDQLAKLLHLQANTQQRWQQTATTTKGVLWTVSCRRDFFIAPSHMKIKEPNPISHIFTPLACQNAGVVQQ